MDIELGEYGEIIISAKTLSGFAKQKVRSSKVIYSPAAASYGDAEDTASYAYRTSKLGETFIITGEPDGVYTFGKECIVEMRREVRRITSASNPYSDSAFLAKSYVCAFLVCNKKQRDDVTLKITLCSSEREKSFDIHLGKDLLCAAVENLLGKAAPFAIIKKEFETEGRRDIAAMPFPYASIREGQRDFIKAAYKAIRQNGRLLVCAPTGIGKTVSALFPAVKAIGEGHIEKAFYLTSKTVTGIAAAKTVESMREFVPSLRAVSISAKERCCPSNDKKNPFFIERCTPECPRVTSIDGEDYADRQLSALKELLCSYYIFGKQNIGEIAEKYSVCPYELSLDLSEYCQVVICDYNYAFDPRVKFRRYFLEGNLKYVFLIDEAHNLPDRIRDAFSSKIERSSVEGLESAITASPSPSAFADLLSKCAAVTEALDCIEELCLADSELVGDERVGYVIEKGVPQKLLRAIENFSSSLSTARGKTDEGSLSAKIDDLYSLTSDFIKSCEYFDERFVFFSSLKGNSLTVRTMCIDPSDIIDRALRGAVSSILFSATLSPSDYYAGVTGCASAKILELESPYPEENLCVALVDTTSTKLSKRDMTADRIAELIISAVTAKSGHYIVYFPSYNYMAKVYDEFRLSAPAGVSAVVQKPGMSIEARNKFLSFFENGKPEETLVGFCVLGGIFSEGIDLPDDKLIGAILVGIGLPSLSSELNILKDYYDRTIEDGFNYAYLYPAMIKIAQAGGRVIRSEEDRGVIVLIDERFKDPTVLKLLPPHWKNLHCTGDALSLSKYLGDFWNRKKNS